MMANKQSKPINQGGGSTYPLHTQEIEGLRNSLAWSYRALGTSAVLLEMSDPEFREAMHDDGRLTLICQLYKMLAVDSAYAERQAEMRRIIMDRIAHGLVERQHPATEYLVKSAIDFDVIPEAPGMAAQQINAIRP